MISKDKKKARSGAAQPGEPIQPDLLTELGHDGDGAEADPRRKPQVDPPVTRPHIEDEDRPRPRPAPSGRTLDADLLDLLERQDGGHTTLSKKARREIINEIRRVIGDEDLRRLVEPGEAPAPEYLRQLAWPWLPGYFNRSCRLTVRFPSRTSYGTGFFITPRAVLTAAHCLYDRARRVQATEVVIEPGFSDRHQEGSLEASVVQVSRLRVPNAYKDPLRIPWGSDYALVLLDKPQPVKCHALRSLSDAELNQAQILIVGYPLDKESGHEQFVGKGKITKVESQYLLHSVDTDEGQSGSGIFMWRGEQPEAVAIHCSEKDSTANRGTRLTPEILTHIKSWLDGA